MTQRNETFRMVIAFFLVLFVFIGSIATAASHKRADW